MGDHFSLIFHPCFFHGRQGSISATWTILAGGFFFGGLVVGPPKS